MHILPIGSRQIAFVQYDDQASRMIVQYHTGLTTSYHDILPADYAKIVDSTNRYDSLLRLTEARLSESRML